MVFHSWILFWALGSRACSWFLCARVWNYTSHTTASWMLNGQCHSSTPNVVDRARAHACKVRWQKHTTGSQWLWWRVSQESIKEHSRHDKLSQSYAHDIASPVCSPAAREAPWVLLGRRSPVLATDQDQMTVRLHISHLHPFQDWKSLFSHHPCLLCVYDQPNTASCSYNSHMHAVTNTHTYTHIKHTDTHTGQ